MGGEDEAERGWRGGAGRGCMHVDKGWDLSRTGVALIRAEPAPRSRDTLPANNRQLAVYSWIWDVPTLSSRSTHPTPLHSPHQTWIFKARWDETGSFPYCRFRPRSPLSYFDYSDKDSCRKGGALFYFALQQNPKLLSYYYSNDHMWQKMGFVELMAKSVIASPPGLYIVEIDHIGSSPGFSSRSFLSVPFALFALT